MTDSSLTTVFIWNLTSEKVGHTSIQVSDSSSSGDSLYMSIHPGALPAIGPTTVLPLPASMSRSLQDDMITEALAEKTLEGVSKMDMKAPDKVYKIHGLNINNMKNKMNEVEEGVHCGDTSYQLLPRVNALRFFKELPGYIAQDPVDIHLMNQNIERNKKNDEGNVYNCATFVEKVLTCGGIPAIRANQLTYPWDPTPNGIAEHLEQNGHKSSTTT